jgi:hypothetical protein
MGAPFVHPCILFVLDSFDRPCPFVILDHTVFDDFVHVQRFAAAVSLVDEDAV